MDKIEQIKSLFPLKVKVTKSIITKGQDNLYDTNGCTGALTILKGLGKNKDLLDINKGIWGDLCGQIFIGGEVVATVMATDSNGAGVHMMGLLKPQIITFILVDKYID